MKILGVRIDNVSMAEAFDKIRDFLGDGRQRYVVTPNPEFLVLARKDGEFRDILNQADLSVADGFGLILASRFLGKPLKERVAGVDLIQNLRFKIYDLRIFLLGGRNGAAEKIAEDWPQVVGFTEKINEAVNSINRCQPDILLVALGAPKQEKWITQNLSKISSVKIAIGVGGAFDLISGQIKRAPKIFQALGIEWLWRLFREPRRWKKVWRSVIMFPIMVLRQKLLFSNSQEY